MKGWWLLFPPQFPTSLLSKKPDPGISVQILASSARCKFWHHPLELKRVLIGYGERELGLDQVSFTNAIYQCHVWEKRWCQLPVFVEVVYESVRSPIWNLKQYLRKFSIYLYAWKGWHTHTILKWASLCMVFQVVRVVCFAQTSFEHCFWICSKISFFVSTLDLQVVRQHEDVGKMKRSGGPWPLWSMTALLRWSAWKVKKLE